jgi:hypothetical protein
MCRVTDTVTGRVCCWDMDPIVRAGGTSYEVRDDEILATTP